MTTESTSGTGEDRLRALTIPAEYLETHGGLKIFCAGTKTTATGDKTIKLHFGASSWTVVAAANTVTDWRLEATIVNTAYNAQRVSWTSWSGVTIAQGYELLGIDTSSAVILQVTGECAEAADTISSTMWTVERF